MVHPKTPKPISYLSHVFRTQGGSEEKRTERKHMPQPSMPSPPRTYRCSFNHNHARLWEKLTSTRAGNWKIGVTYKWGSAIDDWVWSVCGFKALRSNIVEEQKIHVPDRLCHIGSILSKSRCCNTINPAHVSYTEKDEKHRAQNIKLWNLVKIGSKGVPWQGGGKSGIGFRIVWDTQRDLYLRGLWFGMSKNGYQRHDNH